MVLRFSVLMLTVLKFVSVFLKCNKKIILKIMLQKVQQIFLFKKNVATFATNKLN